MAAGSADGGRDRYLAFDTSGPGGSVAVGLGEGPLASVVLKERVTHASRLVPAIDQALGEAGVDRLDLRAIVVGEGPGSFTGVRVAAATAKGLARALDLLLLPVSSLLAAALAWDHAPIRYVLFDARADRVYGACFGVGTSGVQELVAPHAGSLREALDGDVPGGAVFVGDGSLRHRAVIEGAGFRVAPAGEGRTLAHGLLTYLEVEPRPTPVERVDTWEPRYVRASAAERLWIG